MTWTANVLVVANQTAVSPDLRHALESRAARGPAVFTLLMPAPRVGEGAAACAARLEEALAYHRAAGLRIDGALAHDDPVVAVSEAWDPKQFDEIIVSTLARSSSRWLRCALPQRIAHVTDAPVKHVEGRPAQVAAAVALA